MSDRTARSEAVQYAIGFIVTVSCSPAFIVHAFSDYQFFEEPIDFGSIQIQIKIYIAPNSLIKRDRRFGVAVRPKRFGSVRDTR